VLGSFTAAKPHVPVPKSDVRRLSFAVAGRDFTCIKL
jgi:hypothetical protein